MNLLFRAAAGAALLLPLAVAPATAQSWKWDIGLNGGGSMYTSSLTAEDHAGTVAGDMKYKAGWLAGAQLTFWFSPGFGLRIPNFTYSERPFGFSDEAVGADDAMSDVNLYSWSADLMFRLGRPAAVFEGSEFLPYLALGAGIKAIHPGVEETEFGDKEGVPFDGNGSGTANLMMAHERKPLGLAALGADWRLSRGFALRLEVGDRFWDTPIYPLDATGTALAEGDEDIGKVVHEIYGQLGLQFLMGIAAPPPVAVVEPPPPPPPAPQPPREETVTVCVIDPASPTGIRMVSATYRPDTRDTLVTVDGNRVALRTTTGNVMVASNADWFVRGEPLAVGTTRPMEFVTFGSSRLIEADDLVFLGTVRGVPVYGDRDEVQDVNQALADARRAQNTGDLERVLEERRELRDELDDVTMLYVPLQPTGCVFQPLQRSQEVRKGGK